MSTSFILKDFFLCDTGIIENPTPRTSWRSGEALCDEGVQWVDPCTPSALDPNPRGFESIRTGGALGGNAHEEGGGCACHPCSPPLHFRALDNPTAGAKRIISSRKKAGVHPSSNFPHRDDDDRSITPSLRRTFVSITFVSPEEDEVGRRRNRQAATAALGRGDLTAATVAVGRPVRTEGRRHARRRRRQQRGRGGAQNKAPNVFARCTTPCRLFPIELMTDRGIVPAAPLNDDPSNRSVRWPSVDGGRVRNHLGGWGHVVLSAATSPPTNARASSPRGAPRRARFREPSCMTTSCYARGGSTKAGAALVPGRQRRTPLWKSDGQVVRVVSWGLGWTAPRPPTATACASAFREKPTGSDRPGDPCPTTHPATATRTHRAQGMTQFSTSVPSLSRLVRLCPKRLDSCRTWS
jgi:hypothetical protein